MPSIAICPACTLGCRHRRGPRCPTARPRYTIGERTCRTANGHGEATGRGSLAQALARTRQAEPVLAAKRGYGPKLPKPRAQVRFLSGALGVEENERQE